MHKENIFDLFNKFNTPSEKTTSPDIIKPTDVTDDIIPSEPTAKTETENNPHEDSEAGIVLESEVNDNA